MSQYDYKTGIVGTDKHHIPALESPPYQALGYKNLSSYLADLRNEAVPTDLLEELLKNSGYTLPPNAIQTIATALRKIEHRRRRCSRWYDCEDCRYLCNHVFPPVEGKSLSMAEHGPAGILGVCRSCYRHMNVNPEQIALVLIVYGSLEAKYNPKRDERRYEDRSSQRVLHHYEKRLHDQLLRYKKPRTRRVNILPIQAKAKRPKKQGREFTRKAARVKHH